MALYALNPWAIALIPGIVVCLVLGPLVLFKNSRPLANRLVIALQFAVVLWLSGRVMMMLSVPESTAAGWSVPLWIGTALIPPIALHMVIIFVGLFKGSQRHWLWVLYLPSIAAFPFLNNGVVPGEFSTWDVNHGGLFLSFGAYITLMIWLAVGLLIWRYFRVRNQIQRIQMRYMLVGLAIPGLFGPIFSVIIPLFGPQLNHVSGFLTVLMGLFLGVAVIRYRLFSVEAVTEGEGVDVPSLPAVELGLSYLIQERGTGNSYRLFRNLVTKHPGLVLTTFQPQKLRTDHGLDRTPIIWLTETHTQERTLSPQRLDFEILYTLESFIKDISDTVILIDDVKYLAMVNGFEKFEDFLKTLIDLAAIHGATLVIPIDPDLFPEMELMRLSGSFDHTLDMTGDLQGLKLDDLRPSYCYLFLSDDDRIAREFIASAGLRILRLSAKNIREEERSADPQGSQAFWLTSSKKIAPGILDPRRLDFEVTHAAAEFLREEPGVVFIDAAGRLIQANDLQQVNEFLKSIIDLASEWRGSIVATLDPRSLQAIEIAVISSRFDVVRRT